MGSLLMWGVPVLLAVPAVALSWMGHATTWAALAQILLPTGLLLLLMAAFRRVGCTTLCLLPLMVLAAFQIVLLFLYGDGSIIGVDMFLNVATTNSGEAFELLDNLLPAILTVVAIYLPAIVLGSVGWKHKWDAGRSSRQAAIWAGAILSLAGSVSLAGACLSPKHYEVDESLYPVNVLCNLGSAISRSAATARYASESAGYRYDAHSERPDSLREVYIAVIGETSRADNWQLFGYDRFTTPELCSLPDSALAAYGRTLSESNTTHKAVPLMLSPLTADEFSDHLNEQKSVISAFKEAGYTTDFISMQARNHSYIDFFASEADHLTFLREPNPGEIHEEIHDCDLLPLVDSIMARGAQKQLIVLHLYGSHFSYSDRYPRTEAFFIPDLAAEATVANRGRLVNAYDNSIRHTDMLLHSLICKLDSAGCMGGLLYASDHGEDIYDDARHRFLHASPTPTYEQLHVPMLIHLTEPLHAMQQTAKANETKRVSSSASFTPTLLHMAGISSPRVDPSQALTSPQYRQPAEHVYLNDRNRAESLSDAGFAHQDFDRLNARLASR